MPMSPLIPDLRDRLVSKAPLFVDCPPAHVFCKSNRDKAGRRLAALDFSFSFLFSELPEEITDLVNDAFLWEVPSYS